MELCQNNKKSTLEVQEAHVKTHMLTIQLKHTCSQFSITISIKIEINLKDESKELRKKKRQIEKGK